MNARVPLLALCQSALLFGQATCDLSPVTFPGTGLMYGFGGSETISNLQTAGLTLTNTVVSFSPPRSASTGSNQLAENYVNSVVDMSLAMEFDASAAINAWAAMVRQKGNNDEGCSDQREHSERWDVTPDGAWIGAFHIKYIKRTCGYYWFNSRYQFDLATFEVDFWNKMTIRPSGDGTRLDPILDKGASDNMPDILKPLLQLLGNVLSIASFGIIPPDAHLLDGVKYEEAALREMSKFQFTPEPIRAPGFKKKDFTFDMAFVSARFRKQDNRPMLTVVLTTKPTGDNVHSYGEMCVVRDLIDNQHTEATTLGPSGIEYTVVKNDSAWKLAEHFYGKGSYHLLISGVNSIPLPKSDHLPVGAKLKILPTWAIRSSKDQVLVMRGDSLWKVSQEKTKGSSYIELLKANRTSIVDENLIFPIQVLSVPSSRGSGK